MVNVEAVVTALYLVTLHLHMWKWGRRPTTSLEHKVQNPLEATKHMKLSQQNVVPVSK